MISVLFSWPIWRDPRLHYALNCASVGCPNLQAEAFTAANTEALLESAARDYVALPRGFSLDGGKLIVSSIYVWFSADFGGTDAAVIAHLQGFAAPPRSAGDIRTPSPWHEFRDPGSVFSWLSGIVDGMPPRGRSDRL